MSIAFRTKLFLIVGTAVLTLCAVLVGSTLLAERQAADLAVLEGKLIPKLELGPRLESQFEHLARSYQNAVAAQDESALEAAWAERDALFDAIRSANSLDPATSASLRWAIQDYATLASDVSARLIAGETGEGLVEAMSRMQARQSRAQKLIRQNLSLRPNEVASAFSAVRDGSARAHRFRLAIGVAGVAILLWLSLWISRSLLRSIDELSEGFLRFATGDFAFRIPMRDADELGRMAREANQMADNLRQLNEARTRDDWSKAGLAGLSDALRGDLDPRALATRSLSFLASRLEAVAAAFYVVDGAGALAVSAHYAQSSLGERRFQVGEGLLGQAALGDGLMVVEQVPDDYARVASALGEAKPRTLLFLPLRREQQLVGVVELGLFSECSNQAREWLLSVREMLVVSLGAAQSRAALGQKNAELEEARARLTQKAEELSRVSSYKSRFLANVSHELRTPLNSMLLLSQILSQNEAGNLTPRQVEHAKTVHGAGEDLLSLINQILDLSKVEAGHQELSLERVPLTHFREHTRRIFQPLADEKGLGLEFETGQDLPEAIYTDRNRVERILVNLVGNAIKFTLHGKVRVSIARPKATQRAGLEPHNCVAFSVSDTGAGIAEEARERIFAPFEQVESQTDRRYAGTGLGLAIARESALLLGGDLSLESVIGVGSTFTCYVPERSESPVTTPPVQARKRRKLDDDRDRLHGATGHLLIVEDDVAFAEQLLDIVHARGFQAVVATDGEEALALASSLRPQGVLLDVNLPGIDGWTVMRRLRESKATANVPVYFLTAVDAVERGLALGAVGYLVKPASHSHLVEAVRALTPRAAQQSARVLVVEDDAETREAILRALRDCHFDAHPTASAAAALEALAHQAYGCMILDLGLPDADGLELLDRIAHSTRFELPRVIVYTGRALSSAERARLDAYAEAIVNKDDSSVAQLLEEIRRFVTEVPDYARREALLVSDRPSRNISLQGAKLLLAEDDMRTVYAISALLQASGAKVLTADSGRDALDVLSKNPDVDGVLMDVMMPEMDGYEAIRRLRQDPRFSSLPVVALTARAMKGERERCLQAGASDYLAKPVDGETLLSTVGSWLANGSHGN
ncbi:MAG: response regulator [Polyangiaceae bacterium]